MLSVVSFGAWLEARKLAGLPGQLVFPGSPSGRPMHKATVLRAIDALMEAAGVAQTRAERASPQTLRNTYAADLFERGFDIDRVGQWLGFLQPISAGRLHRAWKTWAEREALQPATAESDKA